MLNTISDQILFGLGFIVAVILWWLSKLARPKVSQSIKALSRQSQITKTKLFSSTENRFRNEMINIVQENHLASPLFSLLEVAIEPRLMTQPSLVIHDDLDLGDDNKSSVIPYLPEWPEMAATYKLQSQSLAEAINSGQNLAIFGKPGIGKSFALNYLCAKIALKDPSMGKLADLIPIIIHVNDLELPGKSGNSLRVIYKALSEKVSILLDAQLPNFLNNKFKNKSVLLLIDGMDELPTKLQIPVVNFLNQLRSNYPSLRLIVTLSSEDLSAAGHLGLIPISLAAWTSEQKQEFYSRWGELWKKFILKESWAEGLPKLLDPIILSNWLRVGNNFNNPFELTLKTWAVYAGDAKGNTVEDAIDAYLNRITNTIRDVIPRIEKFAQKLLLSSTTTLSQKFFQLNDGNNLRKTESPEVQKILPKLLSSKIMVSRTKYLIGFVHPLLLSYLAACDLAKSKEMKLFKTNSNWSTYTMAKKYLARKSDLSESVVDYLDKKKSNSLNFGLQKLNNWSLSAPLSAPTLNVLMRKNLGILKNENLTFGNRCRAMVALATSGQKGIDELFRRLAKSEPPDLQILGALGSGLIQDSKAIGDISNIFRSTHSSCLQAACLALLAIDSDRSLEILAKTLLYGNQDARRYAAEALSSHPRVGHEYLKNGAEMEDFSIRRAAVYGLGKIDEGWAREVLSDLQLHDEQWVVRAGAASALETSKTKSSPFPQITKEISDIEWLLSFASDKGMGISPGQAGWDMLFLAIREGNEEQILGALEILRLNPNKAKEFVDDIYLVLNKFEGEIKEAAYNTLWHLDAMSVDIDIKQ